MTEALLAQVISEKYRNIELRLPEFSFFLFFVLIVKNRTPTTHLAIMFNIEKLMLLTLSTHAQESCSCGPVCLSVCHALNLEITDN